MKRPTKDELEWLRRAPTMHFTPSDRDALFAEIDALNKRVKILTTALCLSESDSLDNGWREGREWGNEDVIAWAEIDIRKASDTDSESCKEAAAQLMKDWEAATVFGGAP